MTLPVSRLCSVDDRAINECGAVCVIFDTINRFFISGIYIFYEFYILLIQKQPVYLQLKRGCYILFKNRNLFSGAFCLQVKCLYYEFNSLAVLNSRNCSCVSGCRWIYQKNWVIILWVLVWEKRCENRNSCLVELLRRIYRNMYWGFLNSGRRPSYDLIKSSRYR
jgi:hypothetical protein